MGGKESAYALNLRNVEKFWVTVAFQLVTRVLILLRPKWSEGRWLQSGSPFSLCRWRYSSCRRCFSPSGWTRCVTFDSPEQRKPFLFRRCKAKLTSRGGRYVLTDETSVLKSCTDKDHVPGRVFSFSFILIGTSFCEMWRNKNDWRGIVSTSRSHSLKMHFIRSEGPVCKIYCLLSNRQNPRADPLGLGNCGNVAAHRYTWTCSLKPKKITL